MVDLEKLPSLLTIKKKYMVKLHRVTNGNLNLMAKVMGISRASIYREVRKHHPEWLRAEKSAAQIEEERLAREKRERVAQSRKARAEQIRAERERRRYAEHMARMFVTL